MIKGKSHPVMNAQPSQVGYLEDNLRDGTQRDAYRKSVDPDGATYCERRENKDYVPDDTRQLGRGELLFRIEKRLHHGKHGMKGNNRNHDDKEATCDIPLFHTEARGDESHDRSAGHEKKNRGQGRDDNRHVHEKRIYSRELLAIFQVSRTDGYKKGACRSGEKERLYQFREIEGDDECTDKTRCPEEVRLNRLPHEAKRPAHQGDACDNRTFADEIVSGGLFQKRTPKQKRYKLQVETRYTLQTKYVTG